MPRIIYKEIIATVSSNITRAYRRDLNDNSCLRNAPSGESHSDKNWDRERDLDRECQCQEGRRQNGAEDQRKDSVTSDAKFLEAQVVGLNCSIAVQMSLFLVRKWQELQKMKKVRKKQKQQCFWPNLH